MDISVFLSYPKPCFKRQAEFVERVTQHLKERGFAPRTLGVTDYDMDAPLTAIRRLMLDSNGLITLAFRRILIEAGAERPNTDIENSETKRIDRKWLTTPWAHIEPAMAYQLGLPILLLREKGVLADGLHEPGVAGLYLPEFDLDGPQDEYFKSPQWTDVIGKWSGYVRAVVNAKGMPPKLF